MCLLQHTWMHAWACPSTCHTADCVANQSLPQNILNSVFRALTVQVEAC